MEHGGFQHCSIEKLHNLQLQFQGYSRVDDIFMFENISGPHFTMKIKGCGRPPQI